jgi:N-acetylglucosamine repressor
MRTNNKPHRTVSRASPGRLKIKQKAIANLEAELLRRVRAHQGLSRVDLARQLHLAPSTVGAYVDRLIAEGFLFEGEKVEREAGRPPTLLALNPEGGRFIGLDFDAHNIMATAVDFSQQPMQRIHKNIRPADSVEQIIGKIVRAVEELMEGHSRQVLGIGIGVPGVLDPKNQIALHYDYLPGWNKIPLSERLTKRFNVDVFLENNIRSMALAELWFGHGRGLDNLVCLGIRTGIAAGIIVRRRLLHGKNNLAGEIGGWLSPVGPIERCGSSPRSRCVWACQRLEPLERIASVPAILDAVRAALEQDSGSLLHERRNRITFAEVAQAAQSGDAVVGGVLERVAQTLGWAACQINALFNPEKIILAGPLVTLGRRFLDPLQSAVRAFCSELHQEAPLVVDSELGDFNGALGAAALALHEWKPKR